MPPVRRQLGHRLEPMCLASPQPAQLVDPFGDAGADAAADPFGGAGTGGAMDDPFGGSDPFGGN